MYKTATLDDKPIVYADETIFMVQIGKGKKGTYWTKYRVVDNLIRAVKLYYSVGIAYGYKKRLTMNGKVLSRQFSQITK